MIDDNFNLWNFLRPPKLNEFDIYKEEANTPEVFNYKTFRKKLNQSYIKRFNQFNSWFQQAAEEMPEINNYRWIITALADHESAFRPSVKEEQEKIPAYGLFQFVEGEWERNGKQYQCHNISTYADTDIETFLNDPVLQIKAAYKMISNIDNHLTDKHLEFAKDNGYSRDALISACWLGGFGGLNRYMSDSVNGKDTNGYSIKQSLDDFSNNFNTPIELNDDESYLNDSFEEMLNRFNIPARVSSSFRPNALTKQGKPSFHSQKDEKGNSKAYDIVPNSGNFQDLIPLYTNPRIVKWFKHHDMGILEETTPEIMSRTGATKKHWHIGPDKIARNNYSQKTTSI